MNIKWDIDKVRKVFEENGCVLVSQEYMNTSTKLKYIASCGHLHESTFENFLAGKGRLCKSCRYKKIADEKTRTYEQVRNAFRINGCTLLSEEYSGCRQKLRYIAQCGHENEISYSKFMSGGGRVCAKCSKSIQL